MSSVERLISGEPVAVSVNSAGGIYVGTLQWILGLISIALGAMMLIIPHQFSSRALFELHAQLGVWGSGFLIAGIGLVSVAVVRPSHLIRGTVHLLAGAMFMVFGAAFASVGSYTATGAFGTLGLCLVVAIVWNTPHAAATSRDLFPLAMSATAIALGSPLLLSSGQFTNPSYDLIRPALPAWGLMFALIGIGGIVAWVRWPFRRPAQVLSLTALAAAYLGFVAVVVMPARALPGMVIYGGTGTALLVWPWVGPRLRGIDPRSLRMRLSLALVAAASLPLIVLAAIMAQSGTRAIIDRELETQGALATSLASNVGTYVDMHQSALAGAASVLGSERVPAADVPAFLSRVDDPYPELTTLVLYDADGNALARTDGHALLSGAELPYFRQALAGNVSVVTATIGRTSQRPAVIIAEPIRGADGAPRGVLAGGFSSKALADFLVATAIRAARTYLIDDQGRAFADTVTVDQDTLIDVHEHRPIAAVMAAEAASGSLEVGSGATGQIVGFARVPGRSWTVVTETPLSTLLESRNASLEALMAMLVLAILVAAVTGVIVADRLTASLNALTSAAEALATGSGHAPLPSSSLVEVNRLTTVFGIMRWRLDRRTAQRAAAEAEIRALNTALEERVSERTQALHSALATVKAEAAERALAERAIGRLRRTTDLILNAAGDGMLGIDCGGRITFANPAAATILGYTVDDLVGSFAHGLFHQHGLDDHGLIWEECPTQLVLHTGQAHPADNEQYVRKDGTSFDAETSTVPLFDHDIIIGAVITFRDVTERRAVDRMKNEFISIVSHELRTPLTAMRGSLGLLSGGMVGALPPTAQRLIDIAASNTDRLVRLINDILDIERMESGRVTLERADCAADELVQRAVEVMRPMASQAGIRMTVDAPPVHFRADADRVVQVLTNLLSNAIKFSPRESDVHIDVSSENDRLVFRVSDQGRGIPSDKLEHIFDRFQQVDASDSRDKGGTGLGLAICRSIVQQHGGEIWATSPGTTGGSTFIVSLPLGRATARIPAAA